MTSSSMTAVFLGALSLAVPALAQPTVGGLLNNYSYIRPGLPNYGIAQGSIFDIFGTNLATTSASQGVPLQTALAGTSISVTVAGVTTQPLPYFVSSGQIAAILPSKTPVGTGTITVTSGGQTSAPAPIVVVESAFGLLTVTASGSGAAAAYNYTDGNQLLTQTNAANPGEYLVLWGSGLGPVTGDETVLQTPADLTGIPIEVDIGGVSATVSYHGRSAYPGLDQINVLVPAGVSGCSVSMVVTASGVPSNYSTIAVAASGRTCSDPQSSPITPSQYETLSGLTNLKLGLISLTKTTTSNPLTGTTTEDSASAFFVQYTAAQFASSGFGQQASIGSCIVFTFSGTTPPAGLITSTPLNAGAAVNENGPDGALVLSQVDGFYTEPLSASLPSIIPATGGTFTFDNGSGGPDVGAFTTTLTASLAAPLVWTNSSSITTVDRANGQLVTWTGGIPGSFVNIFGFSLNATSATDALGAIFSCTAPVSAGQFMVPAAVLDSLPPSTTIDGLSIGGSLSLENSLVQQFTATGLDLGLLDFTVSSDLSVTYN